MIKFWLKNGTGWLITSLRHCRNQSTRRERLRPEISLSFLNSLKRNDLNQIFIEENVEGKQFIAHASISDRDSGENGQVEWKVFVNGKEVHLASDDELLSINKLNSNSFTISTGSRAPILFDRETLPSINVTISSWDQGQTPNFASFNFTLLLLDRNDNAPQFIKTM